MTAVEGKLRRLETLRAELPHMVVIGCHGAPADYRVIAMLADYDHGHCLSGTHGLVSEAV